MKKPTRSAIMKASWKARKAQLRKTTAKTTPATKEEEGAARQAIGAEQALTDYRALYSQYDDELRQVSKKLVREEATRNSLDRDLDTISKLVEMLKCR